MKQITNEEFDKAYSNQDNRNIISAATKKYSKCLSPDAQKSCGMHGLWRCIQNHDDKYGRKFTTSLYIHVEWECKREAASFKRKPLSLLGEHDQDIPCDGISSENISELIEVLSDEQKDIIFQRFYDNKTLQEIGETMGYSKEAARQNINKIIIKLREYDSISTRI